jgi:glycerol-3-phosphate acyltransferase PlsY
MLELGLKFTAAYLLGSIVGSLVLGGLRGIDIRTMGSGNAGGTNALRTQGKVFALWVMAIDVGKGVLAVMVLPELGFGPALADPVVSSELIRYAVAFGAILGHVYPLWFDFKGGKGGATGAGVICVLAPGAGIFVIALWLGVVALTGFVALATMTAALGAVAYLGVTGLPQQSGLFVLTVLTAGLLIYTHRGNIRRLVDGSEHRMGKLWRGP